MGQPWSATLKGNGMALEWMDEDFALAILVRFDEDLQRCDSDSRQDQSQVRFRTSLTGCPEGVLPSARRARTPAGQPPGRRRYSLCGTYKSPGHGTAALRSRRACLLTIGNFSPTPVLERDLQPLQKCLFCRTIAGGGALLKARLLVLELELGEVVQIPIHA
jgi:hypothetical protein